MSGLPSGTVTFLFTDLAGSTRLWERYPDAMRSALARHDEILRDSVTAHDGHVVKTTGDGIHAAFATARDAIEAAVAAQRALVATAWDTGEPLAVRMGVHSGEAESRDGDYFGSALNRAARLMSVAHGEQILVSLSTEELVSDSLPVGLSLLDLGEQRLRDLSRPERIFQVVDSQLRTDFPPIRTLDAFPGNLPLQITSFVGRVDELQRLSEELGTSRLVTLTGTGGVGKTRLAVQLAADVLGRFADGAWLFEFATLTDPEAVTQLVASVLSVPPRADVSLEGAVLELLRSKRALVILDNCEHLLESAGALAESIVRECEYVCVLATSREALGVPGERVWPVRSLPIPPELSSPIELEAVEACRLFCERAEAARPGFVIDETNVAAVAEICRRLDGIPLAIELAAARLPAMSATEIAGLLDERFRLLTGGRRAVVERHRTLRATVDWSYGLLDPVDRRVFDRLGVFAGSFDAAGATAVVATDDLEPWDVIDALSSLVAKSMLAAESGPADSTRYQMLETLRQHAMEQLDSEGVSDRFRRRHAEYYAQFAEEAGAALVGRDELLWRPRLNAERDNVRAAVYWALDGDDDDSLLALRIIAALCYEALMDPPSGIGAWAQRAVDIALRSAAPERMAVLGAAAYAASNRAQHDLATSWSAAALRDGIDANSVAPGLAFFAAQQPYALRGNRHEAVRVSVEGAQELEAAGTDPFGRVMMLTAASYFEVDDGDPSLALVHAESALAVAQEIENPSAILCALMNIGRSVEAEDPVRALDAFEQAIALGGAGATHLAMGPALVGVARLRSHMQNHLDALEALREAVTYSVRVGYLPLVVEVLGPGADILLSANEPAASAVLAGGLLEGALAELNVSPERNAELEHALRVAWEDRTAEYHMLFERGTNMSFEEIIGFALAEIDRAIAATNR